MRKNKSELNLSVEEFDRVGNNRGWEMSVYLLEYSLEY